MLTVTPPELRLNPNFKPIAPSVGVHPRLHLAFKFMRSCCGGHLTVREVAEHAGLSSSRLEHLFKIETGNTFSAHLRELRMIKAEALLADGSLRVRQIAFSCGYESVSSFTRDFKSRFGEPPSHYRCSRLGKEIAGLDNEPLLTA